MCTYRTESTSDGYNVAAFLLLSSSLSHPNMKLYESAEKFDEVSLTKHCFLLNMSMDGCSVRLLFSALSYVWKWRCMSGGEWEENLPLIIETQILLFVLTTSTMSEAMEMTVSCFSFFLSRFQQRDTTMKWRVTINFRWCNYPKVHNHSIIQRMLHQSPVHLWLRR